MRLVAIAAVALAACTPAVRTAIWDPQPSAEPTEWHVNVNGYLGTTPDTEFRTGVEDGDPRYSIFLPLEDALMAMRCQGSSYEDLLVRCTSGPQLGIERSYVAIESIGVLTDPACPGPHGGRRNSARIASYTRDYKMGQRLFQEARRVAGSPCASGFEESLAAVISGFLGRTGYERLVGSPRQEEIRRYISVKLITEHCKD